MKILVFLISVLALGYATINHGEAIGVFQASVIQFISRVDRIAACNASMKIEIGIQSNKTIECLKQIKPNELFCDSFTVQFKPCIKTLVEEVDSCDPDSNRLWSRTIDIMIQEMRNLCETSGKSSLEAYNPCVSKVAHLTKDCRFKVLEDVNKEFNIDQNGTMGLKDLKDYIDHICKYLPDFKKCITSDLQKECQNEITRKKIQGYLDLDRQSCNHDLPLNLIDLFFSMKK